KDGDPRLQLVDVRGGNIECHGCLSITRAWIYPGRRPRELVEWIRTGTKPSEALAKPSSDLSEIAVSPCFELPRMPRFDMFKVSVLRIDQEPRRHGERCVLRLVGQPAEAERAAEPYRTVEDLGCELDHAGELRGAAAQHDARLGLRRERRIRKPVPDHLKNLLGA